MAKALIVEILGDAKQFGAELDAAAGKTRRFGAIAGVAGAAVAAGLAVGLEKSIEAGEKLKVAQDSLATAIDHTGGNAKVLMAQYTKTAKAAAEFGINQTDATTALARATVLTGNSAKAQRAYQEALVISKATGKDFNAVLTATSKGQEGITTSLQRYGIQLKKGTDGQTQYNDVMARFGGQAAANTTATEQLRANFQNLEADVGEKLLPAFNAIVKGLDDVVKWFESPAVSGAIKNFTTGFVNAIQPAVTWVKTNWPTIKQIIVTTVQDAWAVVKGVLDVFRAGWREFGGTIKTIVHNDFEAIKGTIKGVVDVFKGVIDLIKGLAHGDWGLAWKGVKEIVGGAVGAIGSALEGLVKNVGAILGKIGSIALNTLKSAFTAIGTAIAHVLEAPVNIIIGLLDALDFGVHYGGLKIFGHTVIPSVNFDWHPFHIAPIGLAEGGIVNSPTLALVGESGPEAVVPLSGGSAGLGGPGITVNVGPVYGTVDADFARKLATELATQLRGGRIPQLQQAIHTI